MHGGPLEFGARGHQERQRPMEQWTGEHEYYVYLLCSRRSCPVMSLAKHKVKDKSIEHVQPEHHTKCRVLPRGESRGGEQLCPAGRGLP